MPLLPAQLQPTVNSSGPPGNFQNVQANPSAFGGAQAEGLGRLAHGLDQLGNVAADQVVKFQMQQNQTNVNDVYANSFSPKFRELYQQFYSLQGKNAVDQRPQFEQRMQELRTSAEEGLPNQQQRRMFSEISRRRIESEMDGMARYADVQNKVWQDTTFNSSLANQASQMADKHNDEQAFGAGIGAAAAIIDQHAAQTGKPAEWAREQLDKFAGVAATQRVQRWLVQDPVKAKEWYEQNQDMIPPAARPILEHQIKAAVQPIEARGIADEALSTIMTKRDGLTGKDPGSTGMLGVRGNDEEIARLIANINPEEREAFLAQIERQKAAPGGARLAANTRSEVMEKVGDGLLKVRELAEAQHPGDPVFADLAASQFMGHLNKMAAAVNGTSLKAHDTVMKRAAGLDGKPAPLTPQELLADPLVAQAWPYLSSEAQHGFLSANGVLGQNQRQANGEFTRSKPGVLLDAYKRMYLPEGDPNKISSVTQLFPLLGDLNTTDFDRARKELDASRNPEGSGFASEVQRTRTRAYAMLRQTVMGANMPEKASAAADLFNADLEQRIARFRADGKDTRLLLTPGSPDYVLSPERVKSFMQTTQEVLAEKASTVRADAARTAGGPIGVASRPAVAPRLAGESPEAYLKRIGGLQ